MSSVRIVQQHLVPLHMLCPITGLDLHSTRNVCDGLGESIATFCVHLQANECKYDILFV